MRLVSVLVIAAFSWSALAAEEQTPQRPVSTTVQADGYSEFPVLKCPATNDAIKELRKKLTDLKTSIKSEAANCKGITADVEKLSKLVTKDREGFMKLIAQGQKEGLNEADQGKVSSYVEEITVQTSNLMAVLTGNDGCFDEDKKGNSLEFLTSLIGEGTKILSVVGGPQMSSTLQLAGEAVTGFMKGMQTVGKNRQGYDFSNADQRIAYANSLCSFFDYRREVNKLVNPMESVRRLEELELALDQQFRMLKQGCPECAGLISEVDARVDQIRQETTQENPTPDKIWEKDFDEKIATEARRIDMMYTDKVGTHTYRSLKTSHWIPVRIKALKDQRVKADIGLEDVMTEMDNVERFMVDNQAPKFMKQLYKDAGDWETYMDEHLRLGHTRATRYGPFVPYTNYREQYIGIVTESLDKILNRSNVIEDEKNWIRTYFSDYETRSRALSIATENVVNYCEFFAGARWYRDGIRYQCASSYVHNIQVPALKYANYRLIQPGAKTPADVLKKALTPAARAPKVADWVESLSNVLFSRMKNSRYVQRRQGVPQRQQVQQPRPVVEQPPQVEPTLTEPVAPPVAPR